MERERGPSSDYRPRPGEIVIASAVMGECPLARPSAMPATLGVDLEGVRISHSPELVMRRVCRVVDIDTRPWESPAARSARFRSVGWRSPNWESVDLQYEAWRHSILCELIVPLTDYEFRALDIPLGDRYLYAPLYVRYAPSELASVNESTRGS